MLSLKGGESKKSFQKFDGSSKTVLEFKAQLIAAKSGKQRKLRLDLRSGSLKIYSR